MLENGNVRDKSRSGRPSTSTSEENVNTVIIQPIYQIQLVWLFSYTYIFITFLHNLTIQPDMFCYNNLTNPER